LSIGICRIVQLDSVPDWQKQYFDNYERGEIPSYFTFEQASSKTHFQLVQSVVPDYEFVFFKIAEQRNFVPRKGSVGPPRTVPGQLHQRSVSSMYHLNWYFTALRISVIAYAETLIAASESHSQVCASGHCRIQACCYANLATAMLTFTKSGPHP
jgi:hypothetical protein